MWIQQGVDSAGFLLCQLASAGTTFPLRICLRVGQKRNLCKIWKVKWKDSHYSLQFMLVAMRQRQMYWWVTPWLCLWSATLSFPSLCPADNSNPQSSIHAEATAFLALLYQLLTVVPFLQTNVSISPDFPANSDFSLTSLRALLGCCISSA